MNSKTRLLILTALLLCAGAASSTPVQEVTLIVPRQESSSLLGWADQSTPVVITAGNNAYVQDDIANDDEVTPGMVAIAPEWLRICRELVGPLQWTYPLGHFCEQAALSLALASTGLPFTPLTDAMNFPAHLTPEPWNDSPSRPTAIA